MAKVMCKDCGAEFGSTRSRDIHNEEVHMGQKGGSSSFSNKAQDTIEDVKNAAGDLGRDIRDNIRDATD